MIQKKICLLGSFAVGKTSLVGQFVKGIFSDEYLSTVGVRVDKKSMMVGDQAVELLVWDIHGDDLFQRVRDNYIRGSAGVILVFDGTRLETIESVMEMHERAMAVLDDVPFVVFANKCDLQSKWQVTSDHLAMFEKKGWHFLQTSAKTGESVESGFQFLTDAMIANDNAE